MSEAYTPQDDVVRERAIRGASVLAWVSFWGPEKPTVYAAEFDRWRAAHDREVAARTLREAADRYRSGQITGVFPSREEYTRSWLHAEADRIEKGDADAE